MNIILFQIIRDSRNLFIISLVIYIIFTYFINYRREIVVESTCYILLIF